MIASLLPVTRQFIMKNAIALLGNWDASKVRSRSKKQIMGQS
ncbi:MAG: hypothetical protein RMX68_005845 [Aulosira sp. ZfuVER01]|nr:hypothetical protein [Aulosira sp. ZfuVER01]MDZ8000497.1 hypothetical protein [Aulosira sp. DedVER01a]MDZ8052969.1 hypothetical protein [Aulosira sp. ZfuCHP01]